jgi:hypothetical protein
VSAEAEELPVTVVTEALALEPWTITGEEYVVALGSSTITGEEYLLLWLLTEYVVELGDLGDVLGEADV